MLVGITFLCQVLRQFEVTRIFHSQFHNSRKGLVSLSRIGFVSDVNAKILLWKYAKSNDYAC